MTSINRAHRANQPKRQDKLAEARAEVKEATKKFEKAATDFFTPGGNLVTEFTHAFEAAVELVVAAVELESLKPAPGTKPQVPANAPATAQANTASQGSTAGQGQGQNTSLNIGSYNVLGSSHTGPGSDHPERAVGTKRILGSIKAIQKHKLDVIGFQEMQRDQMRVFNKKTKGQFGVYPGIKHLKGHETENSIAWNKKEWKMVKAKTVKIPYFEGHMKRMPVVLLENKKTGQKAYFTNFHNPADTRHHHAQGKYRARATKIEIALVKQLEKKTGLPVFMTGDMNEKASYGRHVTAATDLHSANAVGDTRAERTALIDWIFGSKHVHFSNFNRDKGPLVRRASDHPLVTAHAVIRG